VQPIDDCICVERIDWNNLHSERCYHIVITWQISVPYGTRLIFNRFRTPASHLPNITLFRGLAGVDFPGNWQRALRIIIDALKMICPSLDSPASIEVVSANVARSMARSVMQVKEHHGKIHQAIFGFSAISNPCVLVRSTIRIKWKREFPDTDGVRNYAWACPHLSVTK